MTSPAEERFYAMVDDAIRAIPEPFVRVLHDYAERAGDAEFDGILDEHGISRARSHDTSVTISGSNSWSPTFVQAADFVGGDVEVTDVDDSVTIYWQRTVQVTLTGLGCTCDEVTYDHLRQYVPADAESWDFEVCCARSDPF